MSQGKGLNGGAAGTTPKNGTDNHLCTPRLERRKCLFNLAVSAPPAGMVKVKKGGGSCPREPKSQAQIVVGRRAITRKDRELFVLKCCHRQVKTSGRPKQQQQ